MPGRLFGQIRDMDEAAAHIRAGEPVHQSIKHMVADKCASRLRYRGRNTGIPECPYNGFNR